MLYKARFLKERVRNSMTVERNQEELGTFEKFECNHSIVHVPVLGPENTGISFGLSDCGFLKPQQHNLVRITQNVLVASLRSNDPATILFYLHLFAQYERAGS